MNWFTKTLLSLGWRDKMKQLVNVVMDVAIKEGKAQIDKTTAIPKEHKDTAKAGVDILAAELSSLINDRLDNL